MSANGISHLQYKADRQLAKLQLAAINRAATGRRSVYDLNELPTVYAPNDNLTQDVINNPNIGGLVIGRPWLAGYPNTIVEGIWRNVYSGIIDTAPPDPSNLISSGPVDAVWDENIPENTTYEYLGYFRANWTGSWHFDIDVDDRAWFWLGPLAEAGQLNDAMIKITPWPGYSSLDCDLDEGNQIGRAHV